MTWIVNPNDISADSILIRGSIEKIFTGEVARNVPKMFFILGVLWSFHVLFGLMTV